MAPTSYSMRSCHTPVSRFDRRAKPSEGSRRVSNPRRLGACLPKQVKTGLGGMHGGNHQLVQRAERRTQQRVVERREHDETRRSSWSSTATGSSRLELVLLLDSVGIGRESEVDDAHLLLILIQITAQVIVIHSHYTAHRKSPVVMGKRQSGRCWYTGNRKPQTCTQATQAIWSFSTDMEQQWDSAAP